MVFPKSVPRGGHSGQHDVWRRAVLPLIAPFPSADDHVEEHHGRREAGSTSQYGSRVRTASQQGEGPGSGRDEETKQQNQRGALADERVLLFHCVAPWCAIIRDNHGGPMAQLMTSSTKDVRAGHG